MKKFFGVFLALLMCVTLNGCKSGSVEGTYYLKEFRYEGIDIYDNSMSGKISINKSSNNYWLNLSFVWDDVYAYDDGAIEFEKTSGDSDVYRLYLNDDFSNFWSLKGSSFLFDVINNKTIKWYLEGRGSGVYMVFEKN